MPQTYSITYPNASHALVIYLPRRQINFLNYRIRCKIEDCWLGALPDLRMYTACSPIKSRFSSNSSADVCGDERGCGPALPFVRTHCHLDPNSIKNDVLEFVVSLLN